LGGAVGNTLQALTEILSSLHDADQRISIPGFYLRLHLPTFFRGIETSNQFLDHVAILMGLGAGASGFGLSVIQEPEV
jgi:hypothetical protein